MMLNQPAQWVQRLVLKSLLATFALTLTFYSGLAHADITSLNASTMLQNLAQTFPNLMQLVTAIAYVMGMAMVIRGVMGLKDHAEHRASRGDQHGLKGAILLIACGTLLLYLPSSVQVGLTTFWTDPSPFAFDTDTHDSWYDLMNSVFMIVQLIGTIAFIRGLIIMSHMGQGHQQGGFGKAIAHIVGGILCINLYQFIEVVMNTLSLGQV